MSEPTSKPLPSRRVTPRQARVILALLQQPAGIFREDIDRIAGASNGPEIISQLRHEWGIEIETERVERTDRDGRACKPGKYRLAGKGWERASELSARADG